MDKPKNVFSRLKIIPISAIPPPENEGKWNRTLSQIPQNKALVLDGSKVKDGTVYAALARFHRRGQFANLKATVRTQEGKKSVYITNCKTRTKKAK